jgi:uncharacterized protein (DUF2147 family)
MKTSLHTIVRLNLCLIAVILFWNLAPTQAHADNPLVGYWTTIDDKTKKPRSIVHITETQGKLFGSIIKLFREPNEELCPTCTKCTDWRKDRPTCGMMILQNLQRSSATHYSGGQILDPANGKIYRCSIWIEPKSNNNILKVRGYLAIFYRTQTWHRAKQPTEKTCAQVCGPKPKAPAPKEDKKPAPAPAPKDKK